jgi:5-methylcytosine-specific restriction endonuclease McrA
MSKYNFSNEERYAIYTVHGEKCYLCNIPIDLKSMQIDHIIPESLINDKDKLDKVLSEFGLSHDFNLNSPDNWLPSCASCNRRKLDTIFTPSPIVQIELQNAIKKAPKVIKLKDETISKKKIRNALSILEMADNKGSLSDEFKEILASLFEYHSSVRSTELKGKPMRLTPLYEILSESNGMLIIQGRAGIGHRPVGENIHHSWDCPNCGSIAAWNGARCVICGMMNDE